MKLDSQEVFLADLFVTKVIEQICNYQLCDILIFLLLCFLLLLICLVRVWLEKVKTFITISQLHNNTHIRLLKHASRIF